MTVTFPNKKMESIFKWVKLSASGGSDCKGNVKTSGYFEFDSIDSFFQLLYTLGIFRESS